MSKIEKIQLKKTFSTSRDPYGFTTELDINVLYDTENDSVALVSVLSCDGRKCSYSFITDIFTQPPFSQIISLIDWKEIYRLHLIEQANELTKISYDELQNQ